MADETIVTPVEPTETGAGSETTQPGEPGKKFTQAELDNIIDQRLKREREKYKDYADAKKKAEQWDKQESDRLSVEEKLKKDLENMQATVTAAQNARKQALIKSEVVAKMQGKVASDRMQAALKLLDVSALTVTDADEVEGVDAAIEALLKDNPFLKGSDKPGAGLSATNPAGGAPAEDVKSWLPIYQGSRTQHTFGKGASIVHGDKDK
jgi:hypothetical protein